MSKREALLSALAQLRVAHPALPQLRDFQASPGPFQAVCIQLISDHNVFSWTYCRAHWMKMIQTISSALCLRALGRPCPCCCWATFCLQVLEFQSWKPHAIQKRFRLGNDDPGASHHDRASEGDVRLGGRRRAESAAWRGGFGSLPQRPCQCSSLKRPSILPQSQLCHPRN